MTPAEIIQMARNADDCEKVGDTAGLAVWLDRIRDLLSPRDRPCDVCEVCTGRAGCDGWQAG